MARARTRKPKMSAGRRALAPRPVMLLDVDGVLADFDAKMSRVLSWPTIEPGDRMEWDLFADLERLGGAQAAERARAICDDVSNQFWQGLPLMHPELPSKLDELRKTHRLVAAASPWPGCVHWAYTRRQWLTQLSFGVEDVVVARDKSLLCGDVFLDDKPEHVAAWQRAHPTGRAVLYDAAYNHGFEWSRRFTWADSLDGLLRAPARFYIAYDRRDPDGGIVLFCADSWAEVEDYARDYGNGYVYSYVKQEHLAIERAPAADLIDQRYECRLSLARAARTRDSG